VASALPLLSWHEDDCPSVFDLFTIAHSISAGLEMGRRERLRLQFARRPLPVESKSGCRITAFFYREGER